MATTKKSKSKQKKAKRRREEIEEDEDDDDFLEEEEEDDDFLEEDDDDQDDEDDEDDEDDDEVDVNFDDAEEEEFDDNPVPEGNYVVEVEKVDTSRNTQDGHPMWSLWLKIVGNEAGKKVKRATGRMVFDRLIWSKKGLNRAKLILGALGLKNSGKIKVKANKLVGRKAVVEIEHTVQEQGKRKGQTVEDIPYRGWHKFDEEALEDLDDGVDEDDLPF